MAQIVRNAALHEMHASYPVRMDFSRSAKNSRPFDLIIFGASGFTGRLVADAVARRAPQGFRWGIAGRDASRLNAVAGALDAAPSPPTGTVVADALDTHSMQEMASNTRVVLSTVGPYARYGTPLVEACVEHGTDYADLTAEVTWIRGNIDRLHAKAERVQARIVHAAGFDSVPSDLGVWLLQRTAMERWGSACDEITHLFGPMSGGVSGGTIQSGLDLLQGAVEDPAARRSLMDPDLLAPEGVPSADPVGPWWPLRHEELERWSTPFVMAAANGKIVRRTRHLLKEPWGDVTYLERIGMPTWARAAALGSATALISAALAIGPVRKAAQRVLPKPGEGPSERVRKSGFFRSTLVGKRRAEGTSLTVTTSADADPGYGATARMLAEMGLHLALGPHGDAFGVLTPAIAGGSDYLDRLAEVGVTIAVS